MVLSFAVISTEAKRNGENFELGFSTYNQDFSTAVETRTNSALLLSFEVCHPIAIGCEAQSNLIQKDRLLQLAQGQLRNDDSSRSRTNFNKNWKFFLGDEPTAKSPAYNDAKWRKLTLPHDWSIEGKFDEKNPAKPEGGGLPTGIGWYRKDFIAPSNFKNRLINIEFDGVYKNSEVWVNGHFLGKRPYGYSSFSYEIGKYLKVGKNTIAVKVDNSAQPDSRWYSGSGIYRNVWLTSTAKVAVENWGTFVTANLVKADGSQSVPKDVAVCKSKRKF